MTLAPIKKHSGFAHVNPWMPDEIAYLLENYHTKADLPKVAAHVRRTATGVYRKLYAMGVIGHGGDRNEIQKVKITRVGVIGFPPYTCPELRPFEGRNGANDALAHPSRIGNLLHYRDGRVREVA